MNTTLRDALHGLAPEPPDDLGQPSTARRRAGAIRRRRAMTAAAGVAAAVAVVVAGGVALPRTGEVAPAASTPLHGTFPDWPRRGEADPARDAAAVDAWTAYVRNQRAAVVGTPRVLYSGGGDRGVVVLHGTAYPGGDRVVVVTFEGSRPTLFADRGAPLPGSTGLHVLIDAPDEPVGRDACTAATRDDPAYETRLLVVPAPGVREARWRVTTVPGIDCGPGAQPPWQKVALSGGAALFDVPFADGAYVNVELKARGGRWVRADAAVGPLVPKGLTGGPTPYDTFERMSGIPTPLGWNVRIDHSRAVDVAEHLPLPDGVRKGERCELEWARSLPDGTAIVFCTVPSLSEDDPKGADPIFVADDARGRFRTYVLPRGLYTSYATVVEGRTGRWLLFVDRPDLTSAALVENGVTRPIPLTHGTGFLKLADGEGGPGAMVTTSDFGPGGGSALPLVEGREVERR